MKPSEVLKKYGWCQGTFARNIDGEQVTTIDSQAASFCLLGALYKSCTLDNIYDFDKFDTYYQIVQKSISELGFPDVPSWNDKTGRTKEEVIKLLEKVGL